MSKISNVLRMLILLKSRGKMSVKELAKELEVGARQVIRYKEDLEKAEIYITTVPGKYGGYKLDSKDYILGLNITNKEYEALLSAEKYLEFQNFVFMKEFQRLVDKISTLKEESNCVNEEFFIKNTKLNYDVNRENRIWIDLKAAIIASNKVKIIYKSLNSNKNNPKERIIHPYSIFQYKEGIYIIGFCEYRNSIREFKVSRIEDYVILDEKFKKDEKFNVEDYMKNCFGIYKDKEINIELKIKHPVAQIVKEKMWVENQEIIDLDSENIIYKAQVKGFTEIKSWILSMGSSVEIIQSAELKEEVKKELTKALKIYK